MVYGFNPTTPLDLVPIPVSERSCTDGAKKAEWVKAMHRKVKEQIEKKNEGYRRAANKGKKQVRFVPGDLVWIHLRKERFPAQRKPKLMPRVDGPLCVLEKVNENAYKLEFSEDYNVSPTFNVRDLTPYLEDSIGTEDGVALRANPFQQRGDDVPHHRKSEPSSPRKEESESEGPMEQEES